jgi:hypothetical protein
LLKRQKVLAEQLEIEADGHYLIDVHHLLIPDGATVRGIVNNTSKFERQSLGAPEHR